MSKDVQPALRKVGRWPEECVFLPLDEDDDGCADVALLLTVDEDDEDTDEIAFALVFSDEEEVDPTVAHPERLKPAPPAEVEAPVGAIPGLADTEAQPPLFGSAALPSSIVVSLPAALLTSEVGAKTTEVAALNPEGLGTFTPAAAAILRSCFSSRLRSFSFCLSISSLALMRTLACISLNLALW